ncbi:MAG: transporter permease [Ferruginibacter sp.]|uniref:ABC transporter permease n=1 Tax=Ferruginibacter sp. TaxID=1940288 RepID=UPI00265A3804|nr:ABC transporter permease [Ferruginibacter sp.]MDB5280297.1 transporter permease [Ferruginibacter sp.]
MIQNFFKTAWRSLLKNKGYSFINISGLAVGMSVAILIGLWVWDEVTFNKNFDNYNSLAKVMQHQTFNGDVGTQTSLPYLTGEELKKNYGDNFKYVSMATWTNNHILAFGEQKITKSGNFLEPQITEMLSLKMLSGTRTALKDIHSVILSASTAKALFGTVDPVDKIIKLDSKFDVKVTGVYEDLPYNSDFSNLTFIAPWQLYIDDNYWSEKATNPWRNNSFQAFVQLADHADLDKVSTQIKDLKLRRVSKADAEFKPEVFLHPMSKWHLYSEFKNGIQSGGRMQFVWLFAIIGFFVLLLACINFMNLSTARSQKRAKEVGIRKAIGSQRGQLIGQFFAESLLVTSLAFIFALLIVQLVLPFFNEIADKKVAILWSNPLFWLLGVAFVLITGFMAGSYPALYLSSFKPVKILKGTFQVGRFAAVPRKVLVVLQFTVSVVLIIGTIVVFNQIQYARNRPVGYSRDGLLSIYLRTENIHKHFDAVSDELKSSGAVSEISEASSATTYVDEQDNGFDWKGKPPSVQGDFGVVYVSPDFGKTIGWHIKEGRDFSKEFKTDSFGIILNETAVKFMGLQHPVDEVINWDGKAYHVVGVVKDMVMQSPYEPVFRTVFVTNNDPQSVINIRINPATSTAAALAKIEKVFKTYNPDQPFGYQFTNDDYARKFGDEKRIGTLASCFAILATFISCLGIFGLASFTAEQRTKEIGVRKVNGASVFNLWQLLSKDFVMLVFISFLIATPIAWYSMHNWLKTYEYKTGISGWIFVLVCLGALLITLLTVSYQSIKAAVMNPVKSLKSE